MRKASEKTPLSANSPRALCLCICFFSFLLLFLFSAPLAAAPVAVSAGAASDSTGYGNARKIARDSAGNLYFAYHKTSGTSQIFVSKSTDNGATWADMGGAPIQNVAGYTQRYPSIAVDSADNLHVVWMGTDATNTVNDQIKYSKYSGGSWSAWANIQTISGYTQTFPSIAVDSQNRLHVVWSGGDAGNFYSSSSQVKYSMYSSGSWSAWSNVSPLDDSGDEVSQGSPSITVDSQDNLNIAWTENPCLTGGCKNQIAHFGGGGCGALNQPGTYNQFNPSISVDAADVPHVIWYGTDATNPTLNQIKYSKCSGGSWSAWTNINVISGYDQGYDPSIAVDFQNRLHALWAGFDAGSVTYRQIKYSTCASNCQNNANWSAWANKTSSGSATQIYPTTRWSRRGSNWGDLMWGWMDGTTVMFATDSGYKMPDWSPPSTPATVNDSLGADIDEATSTTQLSANWSAASDPQSGIAKYWYAIGTSAGATDTRNWTDAGLVTATTAVGLTLTNGQIYYFSVKAQNNSGVQGAAANSDGATVNAPASVSAGAASGATCCGNAREIVRDSTGNLYFTYIKNFGGSNQVFVSKSTDNGGTWADMGGAPIQNIAGYAQWYPAIAIDSQDNLHVTWLGGDAGSTGLQAKYSKYSGGSWSAWVNISSVAGYGQDNNPPSIAVDSQDDIHVVWNGPDAGEGVKQIKYSKYSSGSWSAWVNIQTISGNIQNSPSITVDSLDNLHVVWTGFDGGVGGSQIKHTKYSGGSWSAWVNIQPISGYNQNWPSIAVDSQDNLHVLWYGTDAAYPALNQIKYSRYSSGSWSAWVNIKPVAGYGQAWGSITIDYQDRVHALWSGADAGSPTYDQVKYSTCASNCDNSANWGAWVNKTSSGSAQQYYPTTRWSRRGSNWGDLMWGWMDGTTVTFAKDSNYKMRDWATPTWTDFQPGDDTWVNAASGPYNVDFADTDGSRLDNLQYIMWSGANQTGTMLTAGWQTIAGGLNATSYTTNWNIDFGAATQGYSYVSARAWDYAGNVSDVATDVFYVRKDTLAPTFGGLASATDTWLGTVVSLNWSPAVDPATPITYLIYLSTAPGGQNFASPPYTTAGATPAFVTGLATDQLYYFVVRARDAASNTETNVIQFATTPTCKTVLSITKSVSSISAPISGGYSGGASDSVPGALLEFKLDYSNSPSYCFASQPQVVDFIPTGATYYAGSLDLNGAPKTDAADADECEFAGGPNRVLCNPPNLPPAASGTMRFKITID